MLEVFGADARERDEQRRQAEAAPIVAAIDGVVAAMVPVTDVLAGTRTPGVVTREMRRRARRVAHDLHGLRRELEAPTT